MAWYKPWTWGDDTNDFGTQKNPTNYNTGPDAAGFGGPGQIAGGGQVNLASLNLPYFQQDRDRLGKLLEGQSPFAGSEWGGLISQLQQRAGGAGPSIAGDAYKQASADAANNLTSLSQNSASPGAARQALLQQGHIQQGLAQGYGAARNQEILGATGQLAGALGARDQINQGAFSNILGQQLGLSSEQLKAGLANQQFYLGNRQISEQEKAAKLQALSSLLAGLGKVGGG